MKAGPQDPLINNNNSLVREDSLPHLFLVLAAQKSHRKIAVTMVAASGLATIPLQKSQGFSLRWQQQNRWPLAIFGASLKIAGKLAATAAASRRSRAISRPQRPRDTKFLVAHVADSIPQASRQLPSFRGL